MIESDSTASSGGRHVVLVVDDTPETLSFLTDALEAAGATVLVALDGASALAMVHEVTPDVVLMDAVMPGMDGFETCRRLKQQGAWTQVPVIFMTGLSDTEHVVRGFEAGGVDYVTKPIVLEQLQARMRAHLANARATASARAALDATGRFLLAVDHTGRVLWTTGQAAQLVEALAGEAGILLPGVTEWLAGGQGDLLLPTSNVPLQVSRVGQVGPDEFLLRLSEGGGGGDEQILKRHLPLTTREAEVLAWIARGKANRDISDILGISARTVNKHLEQIFAKLGVENRASAAAIAARHLAQRG